MNHSTTDFQTEIRKRNHEQKMQEFFPGKHCGAEDCETQCAEALKIARKLNLDPVPFVQNFIVDKIAPEYGCFKPDCTAEILENMRCRFGFVRPETAVPFDDSKKIVAKLFVAEKTASKTGTCKKCLGYDGKIYHLPEDESKMPELPLHPHCKCHYVDLTAAELAERNRRIADTAARLVANAKEDENAEINEAVARKMAEAAVIAGETLYAEKKTESPDTMFLYFNGRYLYSSDGKFVKPAGAGEPVKDEIKYTILPVWSAHKLEERYKTFDYSRARQAVPGKGPLPEGLYSIKNEESGSIQNGNVNKHLKKNISWGFYHWSLIPDKDTDMLGRDPKSFTIHGGWFLQSAGCIDLTSHDIEFRRYIRKQKTEETFVYVQYPETLITIKSVSGVNMQAMPGGIMPRF